MRTKEAWGLENRDAFCGAFVGFYVQCDFQKKGVPAKPEQPFTFLLQGICLFWAFHFTVTTSRMSRHQILGLQGLKLRNNQPPVTMMTSVLFPIIDLPFISFDLHAELHTLAGGLSLCGLKSAHVNVGGA